MVWPIRCSFRLLVRGTVFLPSWIEALLLVSDVLQKFGNKPFYNGAHIVHHSRLHHMLRVRVGVLSCHVTSCHVASHQVAMSCHMSCRFASSCDVMSHVMSFRIKLRCHVTCHVASHQVAMSCHMSCRFASSCELRCHVMSCHVMSCHVMSCHVMSCHVTSRHVTSRHVMSFKSDVK